MIRYCLDTSFLINAWNRYYRRGVFPSLWEFIDERIRDGVVFSCREVLEELKEQKDDLSVWAKQRKEMFENPNQQVLAEMSTLMARFPNLAAKGVLIHE